MDDEFKTLYFAPLYDTYRKDEPKKSPNIRFVPLEGNTEDDLRAELEKHACENPTRLVWMRYKYRWEDKWHYSVEACCTDLEERIIWFNDWWEGQEDVEYLAVSWHDPID